ncbi:hypothetical protein LUZ60_005114 [Juncus effusus]|nr:hypothetical protein LUZ60_005114 [Juncus effusus]
MVSRYNLKNNSHLQLMFNTRSRWIPAYFRDNFFANMSTSQRSESMNSLLKNWVDSHTSIYKFVVQFDKMLQSVYARESEEDFRTLNEEASLWSPYPIEKEARKVYTRNVFSSFKNRLRQSCEYNATAIEHYALYEVKRMESLVARNYFPNSYKVEIDIPNSKVSCECKGFEFQGMLCAHALRVMQVAGIMDHLPNNYVLKRWTKNANKGVNISSACINMGQTVESQGDRYELHALMLRIIEKSLKIPSVHELTYQKMKELETELDEHIETYLSEKKETDEEEEEEKEEEEEEENELVINVEYHDPPVSQCKGRRKPQRQKPPAEANVKKRRKCSTCGKREGHNFRTCPQRKKEVNDVSVN